MKRLHFKRRKAEIFRPPPRLCLSPWPARSFAKKALTAPIFLSLYVWSLTTHGLAWHRAARAAYRHRCSKLPLGARRPARASPSPSGASGCRSGTVPVTTYTPWPRLLASAGRWAAWKPPAAQSETASPFRSEERVSGSGGH